MENCPCCSGLKFKDCCADKISRKNPAQTPLELMRARYSAYAVKDIDFLVFSQDSRTHSENIRQEIADFANAVKFIKLEIHNHQHDNETQGHVNFSAYYASNGQIHHLTENSQFVFKDGEWFYLSGDTDFSTLKINRNETCPCGSGKKFKRCCANK
ncbi:YchJ family protein [Catenovulum sediminis]|uniref:YchJ family protein n=1 Tax=Catenovulum sediminis TaxID=1740262 RepID=UPI001180C715|nr:YchJ family metal-binding protein [Catenovulum sediminis]